MTHPQTPDIWITGMGAVSALGAGTTIHHKASVEGRSGLKAHSLFNGAAPDPIICGMVPPEVLSKSIDDSAKERADLLQDIALDEAVAQAGLGAGCRVDTIVGTTLANLHGATNYYRDIKNRQPADVALVQGFIASSCADHAARRIGATGRRIAVSSACASGVTAAGTALLRMRAGLADMAMVCGVDALSPFVVSGFSSLMLCSKQECRPFDEARDGLNPGEGAAVLVLENAMTAAARGSIPLAKVAGFGQSLESFHATRSHPEGRGIVESVQAACAMAGCSPQDINAAHLHGTATKFNDASEYCALKTLFGEKLPRLPVFSTKSMTGHTFGASGTIGAVFAVLAMQHQFIPPTLFLQQLDPQFQGLNISSIAREVKKLERLLVTALGFGGESAALILERVI